MIYLDTSALVKLYVLETGSEFVQNCLSGQEDPIPVWEMQEAELTNALHLKVFWNELTLAEAEVQIGHFRERRKRGVWKPDTSLRNVRRLFSQTFERRSSIQRKNTSTKREEVGLLLRSQRVSRYDYRGIP